jgi:hypothetical protein
MRLQYAVFRKLKIAVPRISLGTIRHLYRDPSFALHGHIKRATCLLQRAGRKIGADGRIDHKRPGRQPFADHRHGTERIELCAESGSRGIGQIVRHIGLLLHDVLGAGHRGVNQTVHAVAPFAVSCSQVSSSALYIMRIKSKINASSPASA